MRGQAENVISGLNGVSSDGSSFWDSVRFAASWCNAPDWLCLDYGARPFSLHMAKEELPRVGIFEIDVAASREAASRCCCRSNLGVLKNANRLETVGFTQGARHYAKMVDTSCQQRRTATSG
jgi:hypothetical protein